MKQVWAQLTFEKGLNVFDPVSVLADGEVGELTNFEFLPNGGVIPRPGWLPAGVAPTGAPTQKHGRGLYTRWYDDGVRRLVLASYESIGKINIVQTDVADPTLFDTYSSIEGPITLTSAGYYNHPVSFAAGMGVLLYTQPGFPTGRIRVWDGAAAAEVATDNIAGRAIVYFLNRFWTGGSAANPTYVRFSEIGDYTNWNTSENFIPVGEDDGEPIEAICVWDRGLIFGKQHSLWFLSGATVDSFTLQPISLDIGCARGPSCLVPTELGVFVVGIDGNVYLYDGASVNKLTTKVAGPVCPDPNAGYLNGAYINGKLYVNSSANPFEAFVWDVEGRWRYEEYLDYYHAPVDLVAYDDRYLIGVATNGSSRLLSVREESGPFSTHDSYRDPRSDQSTAAHYIVTTKQFWPAGPVGKAVLKAVYVRYTQWWSGNPKLWVTPVVDGVRITAQGIGAGGKATAGTYAERLDFAAGESATMSGRNFQLEFSASSNGTTDLATYSIEEVQVLAIADEGRR